jgi:hypothetical protein
MIFFSDNRAMELLKNPAGFLPGLMKIGEKQYNLKNVNER